MKHLNVQGNENASCPAVIKYLNTWKEKGRNKVQKIKNSFFELAKNMKIYKKMKLNLKKN